MFSTFRIFAAGLLVCSLGVGHDVTAQSLETQSSGTQAPDARPNVVVMMVDDLGFSDLGCYGSEIETPNLDRLAGGGIRFSQFYNTAKCHSSRVSLLTGQYCIAAGDTSLKHGVTSAEVLGQAGYSTIMTGKWHLKQEPTDFGFKRYFGHLSGACNYFKGDKTFRLNGEPWTVPDQGFYTTTANIDYSLKFLDEVRDQEQSGSPWYLYVAFNAPHAPLQALPEDYAKYEGRYDVGWDAIRDRRIAKQHELGLLDSSLQPSPRPRHVPQWSSLSEDRKTFENKRMTTLAAMIDRVDQEVGRLIENLKANGELDNTIIWFVSDNGACPYDRTSTRIDALPTDGSVSWSDSTGWAWARNSPFRYYKQNQFEGGISTPSIVHWPAGLKSTPGSIVRQPAHLIDIMPTLAELAGTEIPASMNERDLRPVSGVSLVPILDGQTIERESPLHFQFSTDRAIRDGDWKAVSFRGEAWELYNIGEDRTELNDLATQHPDKLDSLANRWMQMGDEVLHASPNVLRDPSPAKLPHNHLEWTYFGSDPIAGVRGSHPQNQRKRGKSASKSKAGPGIRARKNTKMEVSQNRLSLSFTGDDPGIAIDRITDLPTGGPYILSMRVKSAAVGAGEVFFTTDAATSLPNGTRVDLDVEHNDAWQDLTIELKTDQMLHKLRIDVCDGPGKAMIEDLKILGADGQILRVWP